MLADGAALALSDAEGKPVGVSVNVVVAVAVGVARKARQVVKTASSGTGCRNY
jgi:hypothetical protein